MQCNMHNTLASMGMQDVISAPMSSRQSQEVGSGTLNRDQSELAKIQDTVNEMKLLLLDCMWVQQRTKSEAESVSEKPDILSQVLRSQQNIEEFIRNFKSGGGMTQDVETPVVETASRGQITAEGVDNITHAVEELFLRQEETLRGMGEQILVKIDAMHQAIPSRPVVDPLVYKSTSSSEERDEEKGNKDQLHPSARTVEVDKELRTAQSLAKYPQRAKCRMHIRKMRRIADTHNTSKEDMRRMRSLLPVRLQVMLKKMGNCCFPTTSKPHPRDFDVEKKASVYKKFQMFIDGPWFALISFLLIISNVVWMGYVTDHQMDAFLDPSRTGDSLTHDWHDKVDFLFAICFAFEAALRFSAEGPRIYLFGEGAKFNYLDMIVIFFSVFQVFFESINLSYLRILRVMRVIRMMRAVRLLRMFSDFRGLLVMTMSSFSLLVWVGVLLVLWMFIVSIALMEVLTSGADLTRPNQARFIRKYYGTLGTTMYTLLQIATGGDLWGDIARDSGSDLVAVKVLLFVFVAPLLFCLVPVIYGYYAKRVFDMQSLDTFLSMHRHENQTERFIEDMKETLEMLDLSLEEPLDGEVLRLIYEHKPELRNFLETSGINALPDELLSLFISEEDPDDVFTVRDFMYGCQFLQLAGDSVQTIFVGEQLAQFRRDTKEHQDVVRRLLADVAKRNTDSSQIKQVGSRSRLM